MSLPPGFGRPPSTDVSSSLPPPVYPPSDTNINPALASASHGASYPPTHLPPKQKHRYRPHETGEGNPGLLAPPSNMSFRRSPPSQTLRPAENVRVAQPSPLVIPNSATTGPTLSPVYHHYSSGTQTGSGSSGGPSGLEPRSPVPAIPRDDGGTIPAYSLTESPRGMSPGAAAAVQPPPPAPYSIPPSALPVLPSPGALISPGQRNSYDRNARQPIDRHSIDLTRIPENIRV